MEIKYKQYIILNKSLKMSTGKSCAMTAHSSFLALKEQMDYESKLTSGKIMPVGTNKVNEWLNKGECVIVLEANTSTQMFGIQAYLQRKGIITHLYIDEGLTEVPMGEPTCLATGVMTEDQFWMLETMDLYSDEEVDELEEKKEELVKSMYKKVTRDINKDVFGIDSDNDIPFDLLLDKNFCNYKYKQVWGKTPVKLCNKDTCKNYSSEEYCKACNNEGQAMFPCSLCDRIKIDVYVD